MWNTKMLFGGDPVKGQWDQEYHETKEKSGKRAIIFTPQWKERMVGK